MVTTHEQTRAGFLNIALEKNKVGDPYVKNALAFKAMVANTKGPDEFLDMPEIRPFVPTASGLSEKSMKYLDEGDQTAAIKELIENFLKPSGSDYIDETIYRYLLIKGDAVGGTMRNRIGALGEERLIRAILSNMNVQGIEYDWMANIQGSFPWAHKSCDDTEIEKNMKALHWKNSKGDRVLGFNLNVPTVKKNVDICLFECDMAEYDKGKIVKKPEKALMLGELKGGIAHSGATAINAGKVYFTKDPLATNYTQWIAFAKYSYKQLKWAIVEKPFAREAYVSGKLEDSWKELESEISESFNDFSKDYYVVFE